MLLIFRKKTCKGVEIIVIHSAGSEHENTYFAGIPDALRTHLIPFVSHPPRYLFSRKAYEIDRELYGNVLSEYKNLPKISLFIQGKPSGIALVGFRHQGAIKVIPDPWDKDDDTIPSRDVDLDVDSYLVFECPTLTPGCA